MSKPSLPVRALREVLITFLLLIYPVATLIMWLIEKKTGDKI